MPVSLLNVMIEVSIATEITPMRSKVVAAFRLFGFSNAGAPFEMASTPVSAAQPEAKARLAEAAGQLPDEAPQTHADDREHEGIDRDGEGAAGLAHPAEVHRRKDDDERHGDDDLVAADARDETGGIGHTGGDRDGDGEHVVDEQGTGDGQARLGAKVDGGHLIVASPGGVGVHILPV